MREEKGGGEVKRRTRMQRKRMNERVWRGRLCKKKKGKKQTAHTLRRERRDDRQVVADIMPMNGEEREGTRAFFSCIHHQKSLSLSLFFWSKSRRCLFLEVDVSVYGGDAWKGHFLQERLTSCSKRKQKHYSGA